MVTTGPPEITAERVDNRSLLSLSLMRGRMVDDQVWRSVFLAQRRCNALREPDSWKQEYARRDSWSRGWRQLLTRSRQCSEAD